MAAAIPYQIRKLVTIKIMRVKMLIRSLYYFLIFSFLESQQPASTSLHKLQEDFFTAFGLASTAPTLSSEDSKSPRSASKSKAREEPALKLPWKTLIGSFTGSPSSPTHEDAQRPIKEDIEPDFDLREDPTSDKEHGTDTTVDPSDRSDLFLTTLAEGPVRSGHEDEHSDLAASASDYHEPKESDGWCTETLVVPSALTTVTDLDNADILMPAETSPFFSADAHLSFVGEEETDLSTASSADHELITEPSDYDPNLLSGKAT